MTGLSGGHRATRIAAADQIRRDGERIAELEAENERLRAELNWATRLSVDEQAYRRWMRGEKIEALAAEHRVTHERMRYKLESLDRRIQLVDRIEAMESAIRPQVENIERWLETGVPATPEESRAIYEGLVAALAKAGRA